MVMLEKDIESVSQMGIICYKILILLQRFQKSHLLH